MRPCLRHRATGQSLVEFALVIPIFLLILFGLIDMGRAVYSNNTVGQAAREAARLAATQAYPVPSQSSNGRHGLLDPYPMTSLAPTTE